MAIAYVNGNTGTSDGSSGTIAATAINATSGNAIVVCVVNYTAGRYVTGVADTASNSYNRLGSTYTAGDLTIEFWLAMNITGHATNVVTATFSGNASYRRIHVLQFSGVALTNAHDTDFAPAGNTDSDLTKTTTTDSTAVDGEMIVGIFFDDGGTTFSNSSPSVSRLSTADSASATNLIASAGNGDVSITVANDHFAWCYSKAIKPETTSIEQEGFRFRNDDGSESAATWKANQDTNITLAANTAFRLRFLLKATGNPDSIDAQAEARVKPSGGAFGAWEKINGWISLSYTLP